ncbi:LLM class flavin-dependent oxidoreductase [Streptomyces alfalfae]|uniref:LLM class flavin-dependent oxidoreductase n=1 Tax=Streptomyces alfalfae TaxID=1642299 RepID=A0A7T4PKY3_9ACTN|nr:LLM class flavin-dependent oxidoreductase [Streptomyces alfalfae]QQC92097.1 LLM class flavin-dependent oxidoreductase [Streptomyces alfalfae]
MADPVGGPRESGRRVGVYYPLQPRDPRQLAPFARLAAKSADRLWMGQSLNLDTQQTLAYLLGQGISPALGVGVSLMPLTHPYQAAVAARSLAALSGKPLTAVFGAGSPAFQRALNGAPYDSPLAASREYITTVSRLLKGARGEVRDGDATAGARLDPTLRDAPPVETGLGVLRERMARLAADHADVALTWLAPPAYLRERLLPVLGGGERRPRVVSVVHVVVRRPGRDVLGAVRLAVGNHLSGPHYRRALTAAGVSLSGSDQDIARNLVDHGVVLVGTADEIASNVSRYWAVGIDEVVLNPGVLVAEGPVEALRDLLEVTAACRAAAEPQMEETP